MHDEAQQFCSQFQHLNTGFALDIGGRNVNGHVRDYWPNMQWTIIDERSLPAKDIGTDNYITADAAYWDPDREYDFVLCTEVFEHTSVWREICLTAYKALKSGGSFVITCGGPFREPHSAIDGAELRTYEEGEIEHYENINPFDLAMQLKIIGFRPVRSSYDPHAFDTYAYAIRP